MPSGWSLLPEDQASRLSLTGDWNIQKNTSDAVENQFQVIVNPDAKQIVFSFKGSDVFSNWLSDLGNSGAAEFAKLKTQAEAAYKAISDATNAGQDFDGYQIVAADPDQLAHAHKESGKPFDTRPSCSRRRSWASRPSRCVPRWIDSTARRYRCWVSRWTARISSSPAPPKIKC